MRIAIGTPGLTEGRKLKADDLDSMAEGGRLIGVINIKIRDLIADVVKFNNTSIGENA